MQVIPNAQNTDMREFISSVSPKGQITLPLPIRNRLGVKPKDKVSLRLEAGEIKVVPVASSFESSFQAIPALDPPRPFEEVRKIAREDQVQQAVKE